MKQSRWKKIEEIVIAVTAWFALVLQFILILKSGAATGFSTLKTITNFFSYFTILSNLLVGLCLGAVLLTPASATGKFFSKPPVQSAIAVYIFIVGLVYNLVLRWQWQPQGWQLVADNLLHVIVPVLFILYWQFYTPPGLMRWKQIFPWLIFPAIYLSYSLLRGSLVNWYPYPFLDAGKLGYGNVAMNAVLVLLAFVVTGLIAIRIKRGNVKGN